MKDDTFKMVVDIPSNYHSLLNVLSKMSGLKKWDLITRVIRIGINFLLVNTDNIKKEDGDKEAMEWLKDILGEVKPKEQK